MPISEIHILPTESTPEIFLDPEGIIKIKGRGLMVNKIEELKQIMNWIDEYIRNPADKTNVIIAFEYLNSFSTAILVSILIKLSKVNNQMKKLTVHWYFEDGDDDILERGEYISSVYNLSIDFFMTDNITGC
jgi:hypothetical protein